MEWVLLAGSVLKLIAEGLKGSTADRWRDLKKNTK